MGDDMNLPSHRHLSRTDVALAVAGWVALVATFLPDRNPVRVVAVWGFLCVVPGAALNLRLRLSDGLERTVVAVATSLGAAAIVSTALVLVGWGSARGTVAILAVISTALVLSERAPARQRAKSQ
jgi:hypothetical protein